MFSRQRLTGSKWRIAGLVILALVGLLVILLAIVDGRSAAWNRYLAQNAAEASALAGAGSLQELLLTPGFVCDQTSDRLIWERISLYADLNQVLDTTRELNVQAYYLSRDATGALIDLINPETGLPWQVGASGAVPCAALYGLHVEVYYPQDTLMIRLMGLKNTTIRAEAAATWDETAWCGTYVLYGLDTDTTTSPVSIVGSGLTISGGIHSSGGLTLRGGETPIRLDSVFPVTIGAGAEASLVWEGVEPAQGLSPMSGDDILSPYLYRLQDFQPGGFLWRSAEARGGAHNLPGGIDGDTIALHGNGLYVTDGPIQLDSLPPRSDGSPWRLTLVSSDRIILAPELAADLTPHTAGVLFYSSSADREGAITVAEDADRLAGLILAPAGGVRIDISGEAVLEGAVLGQRVMVNSAGGVIRHQPAYCPPAPEPVALVDAPQHIVRVARVSAGDGE
ncbi:MAG: hypothetical protein HPY64_01890 [Anaerolineae bacterium]|nr:hypothetical protein [Anaerolineae bacterium]